MENRKDQKPDIQKEAVWILKSLLCAYVVTGILLLLLALFAYKLNLEEKQVTIAVMAIYLVSTFVGGFMIGKWNRVRKFCWGMLVGAGYFMLLLIVSLGIYHSLKNGGVNVVTVMFLCLGGGLLGGMLA